MCARDDVEQDSAAVAAAAAVPANVVGLLHSVAIANPSSAKFFIFWLYKGWFL